MNQNAILSDSVRREPLAAQVAARLRLDIFTGKYAIGDKLPPERDIAETIGVSRVTVRQALQELAREEWIEIVQGRGATVLDFKRTIGLEVLPTLLSSAPQHVVTPETYKTMHEFSNWLYREICASASLCAKPGDEKIILGILNGYEKKPTIRDYCRVEAEFYYELLRISGNMILQMVFNTYIKTFRHLIETGTLTAPPLPRELYIKFNTELTKAVCAKKTGDIDRIIQKNKPEIQAALGKSLLSIGVKISE